MRHSNTGYSPPISLNPRSRAPMYQQICDWIRTAICSGTLKPGQRLPSTRAYATELNTSRITVLGAFEQLHAEGYLQTRVGSGTYVADTIPDCCLRTVPRSGVAKKIASPTTQPAISKRVQQLNVVARSPWLQTLGPFRLSLPSLDHLPLESWSRLLAKHSRDSSRHLMAYGDAMGYLPLREAICEYIATSRGVRCDPSRVMIVNGSQQALEIASRVLLDVGDSVWVEDPGYFGARQAFLMAETRVVPVRVDESGLDVQDGIKKCPSARAIYITPSHQYPLGVSLTATRRLELLNWAAKARAWVLEDDFDSEYRYGSRPLISLQGIDVNDTVVYIGTFSKVLFPALRIGYIVLPPPLVPAFIAAKDATDIFSSTVVQAALAEFVSTGQFARHIRRMRTIYAEKRAVLTQSLDKHFGTDFPVIGEDAGVHLVMRLPGGIADERVATEAAKLGISAAPLSRHYHGARAQQGLVLGFGGISLHQIEPSVLKLKRAVQSSR